MGNGMKATCKRMVVDEVDFPSGSLFLISTVFPMGDLQRLKEANTWWVFKVITMLNAKVRTHGVLVRNEKFVPWQNQSQI